MKVLGVRPPQNPANTKNIPNSLNKIGPPALSSSVEIPRRCTMTGVKEEQVKLDEIPIPSVAHTQNK